VYALSYSNRLFRRALGTLVIVENIIVLVCGILTFRRMELTGGCLVTKAPIEIAIIACAPIQLPLPPFTESRPSGAVGVTHGILWSLTIHNSWRKKAPITSLVMRDGSWVFAVLLRTSELLFRCLYSNDTCVVLVVGCTANAFAPKHRPVFNPFS
jgi:hypothetical protein